MGEGETGLAKSKAVPIDQFSWEGGGRDFRVLENLIDLTIHLSRECVN